MRPFRILLSPAKRMEEQDDLPAATVPVYLDRAEELKAYLQGLSYDALKALWQCGDQIATLNVRRLRTMDLRRRCSPAALCYDGIAYQHMAPGVFSDSAWAYVQAHLRILSGFYGVLRPLDGIVPYRLEMQARTNIPTADGVVSGLYRFWGDSLYRAVAERRADEPYEGAVLVNLASQEYSRAVSPYLAPQDRFLTCTFALWTGDGAGGRKLVTRPTEAKMARGEMVRFLAERGASEPEEMQAFTGLNYRFHPKRSTETSYVFIKEAM